MSLEKQTDIKWNQHPFDFLGQNQVIKMQNRMSQNPIEKRS